MAVTVRSIAVATLAGMVLGAGAPARAADERPNVRHETTYLLHADAGEVALMLGAGRRTPPVRQPPAPLGIVHPGARPDPSRQPELVARARLAPRREPSAGRVGEGGRGFSDLLPGEMGPPIAIPGQNALLVTGTPEEIDGFREILRLFDVPSAHVRIRADIVNVMARVEEALGLDFIGTSGPVDIGTSGSVPPDARMALRLGTGNFAAVMGAVRRQTRGSERVGAEIVTMSNVPALISAGVTIPYFVPETIVTEGVVSTHYTPVGAFVGMELYVLPRVNADDTVSMHIRPTLIDQTGTVLGPGGAAPMTKQTLTDALIRVPDGQTVCISGLPRRQDSTSTTPLGRRRVTDDSELLVLVTPTILRPVNVSR